MSDNSACKSKDCLKKISFIFKLFEWKLKAAEFLSPLVNLGLRLWMADVFWKSAILKLPYGFLGVGEGDWSTTLYLFESEHPIPGIPPHIAAFVGTTFEFICPILLFFGFGTRFASAILFAMSLSIQLTYEQNIQHIYWMILLTVLMFYGAGKISLDYFIRKKFLACEDYKEVVGK